MSAPTSAPRTDADPASSADGRSRRPLWTDEPGVPTAGERVRVLLFAAVAPVVAGYVALAALVALVVALAPGSAMSTSGVLAATGPTWLAAAHVELIIGGHPLSVLPLLPTIGLCWLAARAARGAADRLGAATPASSRPIFLAVALGHGAFAVVLSTVGSAGKVDTSPVLAFILAALFASVGVAFGLLRRCGLVDAVLARADDPTRSGLRAGLVGLVGLAAAGAVLLLLALVLSWTSVAGMFRADAPGFGAGLGMLVLCLGYLPNVLVGALSFAVGPGLSMGSLVVRPLTFHAGPVLGMPVLGALPVHSAAWWIAVFLLPAAVGVAVGWACRRVVDPAPVRSRRGQQATQRPDRAIGRLRAVGVAALTVGAGCLIMAALAGGSLGDGAFSPVTIQAGLLALAAFAWVGVAGAVTALVAGPHPEALVALATRMADAISDPDEDEEAEAEAVDGDVEDEAEDEEEPVVDVDEYDAEDHTQPATDDEPEPAVDEPDEDAAETSAE